MEQKVKKIMASVFNLDENEIGNDASPETIEVWDSLKHMNLILAIEEEFDIQLEDDEIVDMMSYSLIVNILQDKI